MGLDDIYARKASRTSAQDVFTDRVDHARSFAASLAAVRTVSATPGLVSGEGGPRWNVLAFHGMGGIGKTKLGHELDRRFRDGAFSPPDARLRSVFVDLTAGGDRSFEELLLRLRTTLTDLGTWRAFDMAFAGYWEQRNPGVALKSIGDHFNRLRSAGEVAGVGDQIQATIEALIDGSTFGLVGAGRRLGTLAMRQVIKQTNQRRLLDACPFFAEITSEPNLDSVLAYLPHLLAWDLSQAQQKRAKDGVATDVVVFLDSWEDVQRMKSGSGSLEDLVNRMAYQMPNILFVVLSREPLDWAAEHRVATLRFAGPDCWPGLVVGAGREPTQHRLEELEPVDRELFLSTCRRIDGQPAIPAPIRDAIADASEGLPYFLDLAADYWDRLQEQGGIPTPDHFRVPFARLVDSVIRDLPPVERNLLSAASVAASFSRDLLCHLVPQALPSDIERFLLRNFVLTRPGWLPFRLHARLRESVAAHGSAAQHTWTVDRWTRARIDAADWIVDTALADAAIETARADDRSQALTLATMLTRESGVIPRQLPLLLWTVQQAGDVPALLEAEGHLAGSTGEAVEVFRVACRGARRSLRGDSDVTAEEVEGAWRSAPTSELRDVLGLYLGDLRDIAADATGAEAAFLSVSAATPEFHAEATRLRADNMFRRSRFADAMEACLALPDAKPRARVAKEALRGRILYWSARFEDAATSFDASTRTATDLQLRLAAARSARHGHLARAWGALAENPEARATAIQLNEAVGSGRGLAQVAAADAINLTRAGDTDAGMAALREALARIGTSDAGGTLLMILAARVACALLADDRARATTLHEELLAKWRSVDTGPLWPVVSAVISGSSFGGLVEPQWLAGSTREDWRQVLRRP